MSNLDQGGGVVVDIAGIQKPAAAASIVKQAKKYVATMALLRKPIRAVTLTGAQYATVFNAVTKEREQKDPPVVGLRFDGIPVERAA